MPMPTPLTEFFWEAARRRRLMILRCRCCERYIHYPRPICPGCLSDDLAPAPVSGRAALYSYTITMQAWHPFWTDRLPYVLATVELIEQEGLRMLSNVIDCDHDRLRIGMPLEVTFRDVAPGLTLPLFSPASG